MSRLVAVAVAVAAAVTVPFVSALLVLAAGSTGAGCGGKPTVYDDAATDAASKCPVSIATLKTPTWKAPKTGTTGACTQAELDTLEQTSANADKTFTDLYDAVTSDACRACVFSTETDDTWQPIVWSPTRESGAAFLNFGACFDVASGGSPACGKAVQDDEFCLNAACPDICTDQKTCLNQASLDACSAQGTAVQSGCGSSQAAIFKTCDTFIDGLRVVCGPLVVDAGSDAGDAAAVDASDASDSGNSTDAADAAD